MAVEIPNASSEKGGKRVVENLLLLTEKTTNNYETTIKRKEKYYRGVGNFNFLWKLPISTVRLGERVV